MGSALQTARTEREQRLKSGVALPRQSERELLLICAHLPPSTAGNHCPPSTTVSTIFMSGSKPGEYSTSLVTLTLNPEPARHRRHAESAPVLATEIPEPLFEVELE